MLTHATIQQITDSHSETLRERISDRFQPEKINVAGGLGEKDHAVGPKEHQQGKHSVGEDDRTH